VLHLDGIERRRLPQKKSGVLSCAVNRPERLGLPSQLNICHSRLNEVRSTDLEASGYQILSAAPGGHVDIFSKQFASRFVFLQGHPEYDADSLMREYRRDVGRFLSGQREDYPEVPENYFDSDTTIAMENYRTKAERSRDLRLFENFPAVGLRRGLAERLAQSASAVFGNFVASIASAAISA
jgi:homoserine O-succinyltransferase